MQPLLKVQALSKSFNLRAGLFSRKKFAVLKNISFCVGKGESIAIIGETGAGKSTLAKLLSGADTADSGQILLENNIIEDNGVRDNQCRHIRMIFQDSELISLTNSKSLKITINYFLKQIKLQQLTMRTIIKTYYLFYIFLYEITEYKM